jgi:predicted amidohydrolase
VDLGGVKTVVMICFDVEFLGAARALAGADLPVTVSANMAPLGRDHGVFATAHALEHGPPHSYVNQVGRGEAFTFAGGTMAVSAHGDRPVGADVCGETVVRLRLDTAVGNPVRPEESKLNYLK